MFIFRDFFSCVFNTWHLDKTSAYVVGTSVAANSLLAATMNLRIKETTAHIMLVIDCIDKDQVENDFTEPQEEVFKVQQNEKLKQR